MEWLYALILKPFFAVAFFMLAFAISAALYRFIPDGAIKRLLYDKSLQKRHPWKFALGMLFGTWGLIGIIYLIVGR